MRQELEDAITALRGRASPRALEAALAAIQQTVFGFSMKLCGHREDAEDTAQETLLRSASELAKFSSAQALAVWLYKVARSRCLMSRRRSKFAPKHEISLDQVLPDRQELEQQIADGHPGPEQSLLRKESATELAAAVLRIPRQYRQVLVLHDMEELSTQEVAAILGLREGTVRVRLHRARAFLRNQLAAKPQRRRRRRGTRPQSCQQLFAALSDYLDRELDPSLCARLEGHLGGCSPCRAYLASLEETIRRCRDHCPPAMKRKLAGDLRQLIVSLG